MTPSRQDPLALYIFIGLIIVALASIFFIAKSSSFAQFGKIKLSLPAFPTATPTPLPVTPTITPTPLPSTTPTAKPTVRPTARPTSVCHQLKITESEFASNKCYTQADYNTLLSILTKYQSTKSHLKFLEASINITCKCQNERSCEFFKESCTKDKEAKAKAEADLRLYRTQIELLIARGW